MEADEFGAGGKIARRRKAAAAASPYFRPRLPSSSSPSPSASSTPNSIFSRLASGAGKVLSSIFLGGTSSSSRASSSDDEIEDEDCMDCDVIADSNEIKGLSEQEPVTPMTNNDCAVVNQLNFQKSDTKFAKIKKLLAQETFSREECTRLVKIIQSRVMDHPTLKVNDLENGKNDAHARAIGNKTESVRTWWSLPETRKSSAPFTFSNNSVNASSPGGFGLQADGLHLHNAAIMKARRWVEEKKLGSTLKSTMDNGACTLNTDVLTHITENAMVSPVDMAKSYMHARPSWASPYLSGIGFRTPSPLGMQLYKDETPFAVDNYSLSSLKAVEGAKKRKEHSETCVSHNSLTTDKQEVSVEALNSGPEVLLDKEVKDTQTNSVDNATNPCDPHSSHSCIIETTLQPHQLSSHKDMDPGFNSRSEVEDDALQKETIRLESKFDANDSFSVEFSMSTGLKDRDACPRPSDMIDPSTAREADGKLSDGDPIETCEPLSKASVDVPSVTETKSIIGELENDSIKKSDEKTGLQSKEMLRALKRGKKAGGYYRRIKGKGNGRVTQRST